ncbi:Rieske (2Fe-2S) protein [Hansschlegelia sp. KR7-227]|uniref:Rieske (2Fe-2S) protein n=1 Tax=Hansschlegelia sp. KR7-227 TaxID=3400914 RepID=UPI003C090201
MSKHVVCKAADLEGGHLVAGKIGRTEVVASRLPCGTLRVFAGRCPHQGANLSAGCVAGVATSDEPNVIAIERPGEVVRCPWHGFEWDLRTGLPLAPESQAGPLRLRFYEAAIEGDDVVAST